MPAARAACASGEPVQAESRAGKGDRLLGSGDMDGGCCRGAAGVAGGVGETEGEDHKKRKKSQNDLIL